MSFVPESANRTVPGRLRGPPDDGPPPRSCSTSRSKSLISEGSCERSLASGRGPTVALEERYEGVTDGLCADSSGTAEGAARAKRWRAASKASLARLRAEGALGGRVGEVLLLSAWVSRRMEAPWLGVSSSSE